MQQFGDPTMFGEATGSGTADLRAGGVVPSALQWVMLSLVLNMCFLHDKVKLFVCYHLATTMPDVVT
jgi:hypothetical protein